MTTFARELLYIIPGMHIAKTKTRIFVAAALLILVSLVPAVLLKTSPGTGEQPVLVMRVDDIQDFAFREAQLFLLTESMVSNVPLSLGVIAGVFGEDKDLVETIALAVKSGSEVSVHGWKHEDLAELSFNEQASLLSQARSRIAEVLAVDTKVLVPPMFSFNEDTMGAMYQEGYDVISAEETVLTAGVRTKVISVPATVQLSNYSSGAWQMKDTGSIEAEVSNSIRKYGFAVIVTHPQEFITDGELDQTGVESYRTLVRTLKESYSFKTLEAVSAKWRQ